MLGRTLHTTSQLPVRMSLFLVGAFFVLAGEFGLDVILGAFAAGMIVGLAARGEGAEVFHQKLDAIGFGFLIPIFFVMSGVRLDLGALAHADSLVRVPLFLGLFLLVRGGPVLLYRRDLDARDRLALALYSATALPLVVAISAVGMATGHLRPEAAAALVGAGMVSVLLFPVAALSLRGHPVPPHPTTSEALSGRGSNASLAKGDEPATPAKG
jgi:Kef-type K+ transport system membrane component KefB